MAVEFIDAKFASAEVTSGTPFDDPLPYIYTLSIDVPSGTQAGDLVFLMISTEGGSGDIRNYCTFPTDFIFLDINTDTFTNFYTFPLYKILHAPATGQYTVTVVAGGGFLRLAIAAVAFRGGTIEVQEWIPGTGEYYTPNTTGFFHVTNGIIVYAGADLNFPYVDVPGMIFAYTTASVFDGTTILAEPTVTFGSGFTEIYNMSMYDGFTTAVYYQKHSTVAGAIGRVGGSTVTFGGGTIDYGTSPSGHSDSTLAFLILEPATAISQLDEKIFAYGMQAGLGRGWA